MAQLRITKGYKRLSDTSLIVKMTFILDGVKNNPYFPSPTPGMPEFENAITAFTNTVTTDGGKANIGAKHARRKELIRLADRLSNYVLMVADENYEIAVTSHFDFAKAYGSAPDVTEAIGLKLEDGSGAGSLLFSFKKVPGAKMYVCQYSLDYESGEWTNVNGTTTKFLVKGLESAKRYWFRVIAVGKGGNEMVSNIMVSRVTQ
jgi:hypothetical protein